MWERPTGASSSVVLTLGARRWAGPCGTVPVSHHPVCRVSLHLLQWPEALFQGINAFLRERLCITFTLSVNKAFLKERVRYLRRTEGQEEEARYIEGGGRGRLAPSQIAEVESSFSVQTIFRSYFWLPSLSLLLL